mgnify:CR=1 FL=1
MRMTYFFFMPLSFQVLCGGLDGIFCVSHAFSSANSSFRSVYPFTAGSFAILSASSIAATVSLLGWLREMSKGIRPSRRDWRTKILNAVVRFMPSSPNSLSACAFRSESIRMLMFVVEPAIQPSSFPLVITVYAICTRNTIFCTKN